MRFVQFKQGDRQCIGVELGQGGDFINLSELDNDFPSDMRTFIEQKERLYDTVESAIKTPENIVKRDSVLVLAPITSCDKVLCVGMNYKDHCEEQNAPVPDEPVVFSKFPSCIIGPNDTLTYPNETKCLDWEAELAIVIGKQGKHIQESDAMQYVFGYTAANDVSARDWMKGRNGGQVLIAKAMDQSCPLGPAIVTPDDLADAHNLGIRCRVNGMTKQDSCTSQLIFKTQQIIAFISRFMCVKPGDLILTGTPPGTGVGRRPPTYLEKGDTVEVEIDKIGTISTKIV